MAAQEARGYGELYGEHAVIQNSFPPDHRAFYPSLNFLPLATLDEQGRPWMSILTGADGRRGFCETDGTARITGKEEESRLHLRVAMGPDDPATANLKNGAKLGGLDRKVAGVGLELLNRRRNKFAGLVKQVLAPDQAGEEWEITLSVDNVLG